MAERGCGKRKKGAIYMVCEMSENGVPLSHFMICPPQRIEDPNAMGLAYQGVTMLQRPETDTFDVWDIVGKEHYPYFPDFVEEGIALGSFSRRIAKNADFSQITPQSRHMILHPRGFITSDLSPWRERKWFFPGTNTVCPREIPDHKTSAPWGDIEMCVGMLWEAITPDGDDIWHKNEDIVLRKRPSLQYSCIKDPGGTEFDLALCMWLPITKFEVIADPIDGAHEDAIEAIESSGTELDYTLEME